MRVLVTGSDGYIGAVLVPWLTTAGHRVVGLDTGLFSRCTFGPEPAPVETMAVDLRDVRAEDLRGFDAVLHLAAISNDPLGNLNPGCTYDINHLASVLPRYSGREIETAGDSFLVVFDGAERAIRCGLELIDALAAIGISIRVGIHSGEVVVSGDRVSGMAVNAAARILAEAGSDEVLVSGTTRDLVEGAARLAFESRGRYRLKGLGREHELFAAAASAE